MNHDEFFCESCQNQLLGTQVRLSDGTRLPICDLCWNQLTPGQRVKIAQDYRHQRKIAEAITTAGAWLELARRYLEMVEGQEAAADGDAWLN